MRYDRDEAVRYMGARKDDREAAVLADTAYLKLRNEVQARSVYRVLDCNVDEGGVLLGGEYFKSAKLAAHIKGCTRAVLLAATLGAKADIMLRRMAFGSDSWCQSRYNAAPYGCGQYSRRRCRAGRVYGAY